MSARSILKYFQKKIWYLTYILPNPIQVMYNSIFMIQNEPLCRCFICFFFVLVRLPKSFFVQLKNREKTVKCQIRRTRRATGRRKYPFFSICLTFDSWLEYCTIFKTNFNSIFQPRNIGIINSISLLVVKPSLSPNELISVIDWVIW